MKTTLKHARAISLISPHDRFLRSLGTFEATEGAVNQAMMNMRASTVDVMQDVKTIVLSENDARLERLKRELIDEM